MNEQAKRDLLLWLQNHPMRDRCVRARGEEEQDALAGWLSARPRSFEDLVETGGVSLKELIENCNRCASAEDRKFGWGSGKNGVMVILNAPRLVNRVERQLMKKESVDLLRKIISAAHLEPEECYITNLVKCENRNPLEKPSQVMKNCEQILVKEMEYMKPKMVMVFGDILPLQRIVKDSGDVHWFTLEHPITLMKNPELKRAAWNTVKLVMQKAEELGGKG